MSRAHLLATIKKLEQQQAVQASRPSMTDAELCTRALALLVEVDHRAPATASQRRARRVEALINAARARRDADFESFA